MSELIGVKRSDAEAALAASWTRERIQDVQVAALFVRKPAQALGTWGFLVDGHIFYRELQNRLPWIPGTYIAYADGSGTTSEKPAGIGVYIYEDVRRPMLIAENIGTGTNNVAELTAIWRALRACPQTNQRVHIHSDSEYAIGSVTKPWAPVKNIALIKAIRHDLGVRVPGVVTFSHVDGHSGVEGNEIVDRLATVGRKLVTTVTDYGCRDAP